MANFKLLKWLATILENVNNQLLLAGLSWFQHITDARTPGRVLGTLGGPHSTLGEWLVDLEDSLGKYF